MPPKSTTLIDMRADIENAYKADPDSLKNPVSAAHCAIAVIRKQWGGEAVYVPKEDTLDERDWAMWELFNGANYDEVGKAFDLTGRQARNRIKVIRPIAEKLEQKSLFDGILATAEA